MVEQEPSSATAACMSKSYDMLRRVKIRCSTFPTEFLNRMGSMNAMISCRWKISLKAMTSDIPILLPKATPVSQAAPKWEHKDYRFALWNLSRQGATTLPNSNSLKRAIEMVTSFPVLVNTVTIGQRRLGDGMMPTPKFSEFLPKFLSIDFQLSHYCLQELLRIYALHDKQSKMSRFQ